MKTQHTALVTGGLGELGSAIARSLHDAGHTVVVADLISDEKAVQTWLDAQKKEGYTFKVYPLDVSNFEACQALAQRLVAEGVNVDILINNAGITRDATVRKLSKAWWDEVIGTNLDSIFYMTQPFCQPMVEQGWGRIVNISSVNGGKGAFGQTNYAASKSGIYGFTRSLALEVARKGVTVNAVSPGYLETKMVAQMSEEVVAKITAQIPMGRLGKSHEIAEMVRFICSDSAGFMTGANIAMNGGHYMS